MVLVLTSFKAKATLLGVEREVTFENGSLTLGGGLTPEEAQAILSALEGASVPDVVTGKTTTKAAPAAARTTRAEAPEPTKASELDGAAKKPAAREPEPAAPAARTKAAEPEPEPEAPPSKPKAEPAAQPARSQAPKAAAPAAGDEEKYIIDPNKIPAVIQNAKNLRPVVQYLKDKGVRVVNDDGTPDPEGVYRECVNLGTKLQFFAATPNLKARIADCIQLVLAYD